MFKCSKCGKSMAHGYGYDGKLYGIECWKEIPEVIEFNIKRDEMVMAWLNANGFKSWRALHKSPYRIDELRGYKKHKEQLNELHAEYKIFYDEVSWH